MIWKTISIHHPLNSSLPKFPKEAKPLLIVLVLQRWSRHRLLSHPCRPLDVLLDAEPHSKFPFLSLPPGQEKAIQHAALSGVRQLCLLPLTGWGAQPRQWGRCQERGGTAQAETGQRRPAVQRRLCPQPWLVGRGLCFAPCSREAVTATFLLSTYYVLVVSSCGGGYYHINSTDEETETWRILATQLTSWNLKEGEYR